MLKNLTDHVFPGSIEEALDLIQDPTSSILAGATGLSLERNEAITKLIDLKNAGLNYIRNQGDHFIIGAMTPAYDIFMEEQLPTSLRKAADDVGDTPLLHAVTIGGNLAKLYHWVDLPPMLWALDATIVIYRPERIEMGADEFFAYSKERNIYARQELIAEVKIPIPPQNSYSSYQSLMWTKNEKAQLNLAFYTQWDEAGVLSNTRVVLSATTNIPIRLDDVENQLNATKIAEFDKDWFDSSNFKGVNFLNNYKSSIEYRKHILRVYLKRAVQETKDAMQEAMQ